MKPDKNIQINKHVEREEFKDNKKIPSNLMKYVMQDYPVENCPWSMSGPQFSTPSGIQQRYCYPKGSHLYSQVKGGAIWTIVSPNFNNIFLIVLNCPCCIVYDGF